MGKFKFDAQGFYSVLDAHRTSRAMSWKQVADQTKVSASSLTRMAQGKRPDVDSLAALVRWSGVSADQFMISEDEEPLEEKSTLEVLTAQFRRDKNLPQEAKNALEVTLRVLYEQLAKK